jgi:hypothetical protein
MEKTLLEPLQHRIPQTQAHIPKRNKSGFVYQDEQKRYFFGTFPAIIIPPHPSDKLYVLNSSDVARPDLLSYKLYKTPELYWVILWLNNIVDPFEGMYPGMLLRVPLLSRLMEYGIEV